MRRLHELLPGPAGLLRGAAAIVLGAAVVEPIRDEDLFWHLATGRWVVENLSIPRVDIFAVDEPARAWLAHETMIEAAMHLVHAAFGFAGLVPLPGLLLALCACLALHTATRRGVPATIAAPAVVLALLPTHEFWVQRPQIVDYLLLGIALGELSAYADGRRRHVWHLAGLGLLWANLHAAFILLHLVLFAHLAGAAVEAPGDPSARTRLRHLASVLALAIAAGFFTPLGRGLYAHTLGYANTSWFGAPVIEFFPPDFRDPRRMAFAVVLLAGLGAAALSGRARVGELFVLCGLALMALRWQRNLPLVLLAMAHFAPAWITDAMRRLWSRAPPSDEPRPGLGLGLLHAGVLVALAVALPAARWPCRDGVCLEPGKFPTEAVAALARDGEPEGRLLNHYNWGGYLIFHRPGRATYVDGRTCDIDNDRVARYERIRTLAPGWRDTLDEERIAWVIEPRGTRLAAALQEDGWRVRHEDPVAVVLERTNARRGGGPEETPPASFAPRAE